MTQRLVHRPARAGSPTVDLRPVELRSPPALPDGTAGSHGVLQMLMPVVGGAGSLVMIVSNRNPLMLIAGGIMLVATVVGAVALYVLGRTGTAKRATDLRRRYLDYLDRVRGELAQAVSAQRTVALRQHPHPTALGRADAGSGAIVGAPPGRPGLPDRQSGYRTCSAVAAGRPAGGTRSARRTGPGHRRGHGQNRGTRPHGGRDAGWTAAHRAGLGDRPVRRVPVDRDVGVDAARGMAPARRRTNCRLRASSGRGLARLAEMASAHAVGATSTTARHHSDWWSSIPKRSPCCLARRSPGAPPRPAEPAGTVPATRPGWVRPSWWWSTSAVPVATSSRACLPSSEPADLGFAVLTLVASALDEPDCVDIRLTCAGRRSPGRGPAPTARGRQCRGQTPGGRRPGRHTRSDHAVRDQNARDRTGLGAAGIGERGRRADAGHVGTGRAAGRRRPCRLRSGRHLGAQGNH